MVININIPRGFDEAITININKEEELPFSDGLTNEEILEELPLTTQEVKDIQNHHSDMMAYYIENTGLGMPPMGTYADGKVEVVDNG